MNSRLSDLLCNPATGKLSHSKLWANLASAGATYQFLRLDVQPWEIWAVYLGCVGGYAVARRWIAAKEQIRQGEEQ